MIRSEAKLCRFCGTRFSEAEVAEAAKKNSGGTWAIIAIVVIVILAIAGGRETPEQRAALANAERAEEERKAENIASGRHCLSFDGSHRGVIAELKNRMRDPDSFQHIETRVTPPDNHTQLLVMSYRGKNGFGGMNKETLTAQVTPETCSFKIISE